MAEELRAEINLERIFHISELYQKAYPSFDRKSFLADMEVGFADLALKERLTRLSSLSHQYLPDDFRTAVGILKDISPEVDGVLLHMYVPEFIATYGLSDVDFSLGTLRDVTQYSSSEFAIRFFLRQDFEGVLPTMIKWSEDENHHVRRLSSEGLRTRLPWSFYLKNLMQDPTPVLPVLENLKADPELYVRKSVANHLNDVSKDNPEMMLDWVEGWDLGHKHTAWIIKHACRSLIKQGHPRSFALFGFEKTPEVSMEGFQLIPQTLTLGHELTFEFTLKNDTDRDQKLAVDYAVHYMKKNGKTSPKVFKLKELILEKNSQTHIQKTQKFQDYTTRKHYPGTHHIDVIINGTVIKTASFTLEI